MLLITNKYQLDNKNNNEQIKLNKFFVGWNLPVIVKSKKLTVL